MPNLFGATLPDSTQVLIDPDEPILLHRKGGRTIKVDDAQLSLLKGAPPAPKAKPKKSGG